MRGERDGTQIRATRVSGSHENLSQKCGNQVKRRTKAILYTEPGGVQHKRRARYNNLTSRTSCYMLHKPTRGAITPSNTRLSKRS